MSLLKTLKTVAVATVFLAASSGASELPANFPGDVPIADYMNVVGTTEVGRSMMVDFHAPGKSIDDVVAWFKSGLIAEGWENEGEQVSSRKAILAYTKNGRRCGVSVTNFILDGSMQMDDTIKGITLQVTAASKPAGNEGESVSESTADGAAN